MPASIGQGSVTEPPADAPEASFAESRATMEGPIHCAVWRLAWPAVLTMLLATFNSLMDTLFVGHLPYSARALAATGVGGQVVFLLQSIGMGISVGATALIARFTGQDNRHEAIRAAGQCISLAALVGSFFWVVFTLAAGAIASLMLGGGGQTSILCREYLLIALCASVPAFLVNVMVGAFRGLGNTRTPMFIQVAIITVHISCNWTLIYGHLGMPALGVRGAATAYLLSMLVGVALYTAALVQLSPLAEALRLRYLQPDGGWYLRILRVGVPASLQGAVRTVAMMGFTGLLAQTADGTAGVAALNVGLRAEALAFMPGFGYSVAASALVGQSLGARDPDRAERFGWAATAQAVLVMSTVALLFYLFASPLAGLFTSSARVAAYGADYLRVTAFCEPFIALGMVLTGALQGAGDTARPTYVTLFTMLCMRVPLGYAMIFPMRLGVHGAWLAMAISGGAGGLMRTALYVDGKWKTKKV